MLEVKNLSKRYGEKQALRSVSFSIQGREAVGFLGINGAGKTTTMNILTGYISASDGDVVIDGIDVLTDPLKAKTRIGYLPEQPPVYGDMRVDEYLNFIYQLKKVKKNKAIRQDREEYLQGIMELVGITDVSKRMIRNLSKGYKQRVGLAQALIGDPEILILDEPTVGLDPAQIIEIRQLIQGKIVADGRTEQLADQLSGHLQIELEIEGNERTVLETLRKIPQIGRVQSQGGIQYTVYLPDDCTDSSAVRRAIFKAISRTDCAILSMSRKNYSLEEVFLRLTSGDAEEPQQEAEKPGVAQQEPAKSEAAEQQEAEKPDTAEQDGQTPLFDTERAQREAGEQQEKGE